MFRGLITTKAERELAEARLKLARQATVIRDLAVEREQHAATIGLLCEQVKELEAAIDAEQENAGRLTDVAVRYEETLSDFERAFDDLVRPIKDPSAVIVVDPKGVPDGKRKRGEVVSLRRARRVATRRADEQAFRRNAVVGPPRKAPVPRVSAEEREAVRAAFSDTISLDERGGLDR